MVASNSNQGLRFDSHGAIDSNLTFFHETRNKVIKNSEINLSQFGINLSPSFIVFCKSYFQKFVPRALMVDLEPTVVDCIKTGRHKDLFDKDNILCWKESAADNYSRGHYTIGKEIINPVLESLRVLSENCSSLQGFLITHSFGGGTGSGFSSLILEKIAIEYGNGKSKQGIHKCLHLPFLIYKKIFWITNNSLNSQFVLLLR